MDHKYIEPWIKLDSVDSFMEEINKELNENHVLYGKLLKPIARRIDNDDVLFEVQDEQIYYAVVHLTWTRKKEADPRWPKIKIYSSIEDFYSRMIIDNRMYNE